MSGTVQVLQINSEIEIQYVVDEVEVRIEVINGTPVHDFIYDKANWDTYEEMVQDVTRWVNEGSW